ncbi:UDP-N-acetylmuramate--alanine ligase [Chitinispirillum alkaliphilum]|nr:UDP-N-acetylmuramate--alanine ligase [Chitinispirillum alkaliphilum]
MKQFRKQIHMVGIGGAGMCPIAELLHESGHMVTGSDMQRTEATQRLEAAGIKIQYDHTPLLARSADLLIYSSAVKTDNLERVFAAENGIPEMRRAEVLGDLMRNHFTVCVSGTHGKTTTTSLIGALFCDAEENPTVLVGGMLRNTGSHAVIGKGRVMIVEADEYDRSFLAMYPSIAIITNIEADHLDCYNDLDDIKNTFVQFTERVPFYGAVIACIDDPGVRDILPGIERTIITYGLQENADYRAVNVKSADAQCVFDVLHKNTMLGSIKLNLPGMHNLRNALACIASGMEMGIDFETIYKTLSSFEGVKRRYEILGTFGGVTVIDDYAHHPGEIKATLEAAMNGGYKRVFAVFQPHLYSRTRDFMDGFVSSLSLADKVLITDIYKARELPIEGVDASMIAKRLEGTGHAYVDFFKNKSTIISHLKNNVEPGDAVVFMGAGDICKTALNFAKELRGE